MNKVWLFLCAAALIYGVAQGNITSINQVLMNVGQDTFDFALPILLTTCFFNGMMEMARRCGVLLWLQKLLFPLLSKLFCDLKDEEALGYICANVVINMFGLGFAATPSGLKAMELMQRNNPDKTTATRSMVTFLVLNTAGVTLISANILASRNAAGSLQSSVYMPLAIISTAIASCAGLLLDRWWNYRKP